MRQVADETEAAHAEVAPDAARVDDPQNSEALDGTRHIQTGDVGMQSPMQNTSSSAEPRSSSHVITSLLPSIFADLPREHLMHKMGPLESVPEIDDKKVGQLCCFGGLTVVHQMSSKLCLPYLSSSSERSLDA